MPRVDYSCIAGLARASRFEPGAPTIAMSLIVDEHRQYLSDRNRLDAFTRAIDELVKPGSVVVDLGAGTGIMGLLACRAGGRRVYCIEQTSLIGLAREIARANGFDDRITFIKELSTQAQLPERADVVVADQIGRFGFDAGILEYFSDARRRFLKPEGVLLPSRIDLILAPVDREDLRRQVEFWNESPAGFDYRPARKLAVNTGYPSKFQAQDLLASPAIFARSTQPNAPLRYQASRHRWRSREPAISMASAGGSRHNCHPVSPCRTDRSSPSLSGGETFFSRLIDL